MKKGIEMKENYIEIKTIEELWKTIPEEMKKDKNVVRNTEFLFKNFINKEKDGLKARFFLIRYHCPVCQQFDTIHQMVFKMDGIFKEKFEKDEPIEMMCTKCLDITQFLVASGLSDKEIIKEIVREIREEEKMQTFGG